MAVSPEPARAAHGRRETIMSKYIEMAHRVAPPETAVLVPRGTLVLVPAAKPSALLSSTRLLPILSQKPAAGLA